MKKIMLAGAAILSFTTMATMAGAQDMPPPTAQPPGTETPPPPGNMPPPPSTMPAQPAPPAPSMPGATDPNAAQPTGAVPPTDGMVPAPADARKDMAAPVGSASNPVTVGGNVTPPPTEAKDYPVCSKSVQDSCINPGERGRKKR